MRRSVVSENIPKETVGSAAKRFVDAASPDPMHPHADP